MEENSEGDEIHIRDYVIGSETHETHHWEPDGDNFGNDFAGGEGEKDCHTDEPIAC